MSKQAMDPESFLVPLTDGISENLVHFTVQQQDSSINVLEYSKEAAQQETIHPLVSHLFFQKISINTADQDILATLPNIGPVLAERIIDKRKSLGGFKELEDLLLVKGIGEKKFAKIGKLIVL